MRTKVAAAVASCLVAWGALDATNVEAQVAPRFVLAFDTSGSMALDLEGIATFGDGVTTGCSGAGTNDSPFCGTDCTAGIDTDCDGEPNDSRIFVAKQAVSDTLLAFGDVEWSLARFSQTPGARTSCLAAQNFECNAGGPFVTSYGNPQCNTGSLCFWNWEGLFPAACRPGTGGRARIRNRVAGNPQVCTNYDGTCTGGDLLVGFPDMGDFAGMDNTYAMLAWMDNQETAFNSSTTSGNHCAHATTGDCELRPEGATPLAGIIDTAGSYMTPIRAADPAAACRNYSILLITDGVESCGGDPEARAAFYNGQGIRTYVIGLAVGGGSEAALNDIATAGGTDAGAPGGDTAFFADDPVTLSAGLAQIVADSLVNEVCNGVDDDCDTFIDEGVTNACGGCGAPPAETCNGSDDDCDTLTDEGVTNACGGCGTPPAETCNGVDDDCDGPIDEGVCGGCVPSAETCNNADDDCDGLTDEGLTRGCGTDVGECSAGTETCGAGSWMGCTATGPTPEVCDGLDNDCDGAIDGNTESCGSSVGECQPGNRVCTSGSFGACVGEVGPTTETCDGEDDDCDGTTDEGNPGGGGNCGTNVGQCDFGTLTCSGGGLTCSGGTGPTAETCDALDNDCDGATDEGIPSAGTCGSSTGECRPGSLLCVSGSTECVGGTSPTAELCNGRDDDCDGSTDEGNPGGGAVCGSTTGECTQGTLTCTGGGLVCSGSVGPTAETCDTRDNDCDGSTDEGNPGGGALCGTDVGECNTGTEVCSGGTVSCMGAVGPSAEACDALDNDCDGNIDEGNPGGGTTCGSSVGECRTGTQQCTGGTLTCSGGVEPETDLCDGLDNDCDGSTDEGNPGGGSSCGSSIGACMPGTLTCTGGSLVCGGGVEPTAETCDGADNDCDGSTDEEVPTMGACGSDAGECSAGVLSCVSGSFECTGARGPVDEVCDGRDNDCDGPVDEGNPGGGAACGTATGECALGTSQCIGGSLECTGSVDPSMELCDGLDNDCDGLTDEGNPGGGGSCGMSDVGECELGAEACRMGMIVCIGATDPSGEICDGLDNDCDGMTDEGNPEGGAACGDDTGECEAGTTLCTGGELICDGGVGPTEEVCDGLDNDCDGVVDDGLAVGAPCGTDVGECVPGLNVCRDGEIVCEGELGPLDEACNSLDDDCDGSVDESLPLGEACGSAEGLCMEGSEQCISGRLVCVGEVPPQREGCDCEDNDCDGSVDEEVDGSLCPDGSACVECACSLPCVESEFGFTCPSGKIPFERGDECFCVTPRCEAETCAGEGTVERDGETLCSPDEDTPDCACKNNECTFPCDGTVCADGTVCNPETGMCVEDSCRALGCPDGEVCDAVSGECVSDPCEAVSCGADEACREGECEGSCATVECADGERCTSGTCVEDLCDGVSCDGRDVCDPATGECIEDLCISVRCPTGSLCDPTTGMCETDPCETLRCPEGEMCVDGECAEEMVVVPDAGVDAGPGVDAGVDSGVVDSGRAPGRRVLAGGGGGCQCDVPGGDASGSFFWALGLLGLLVLRRRRVPVPGPKAAAAAGLRRAGKSVTSRWLGLFAGLALLIPNTGCDVDPFCLDCVDAGTDTGPPVIDSGRVDADTGAPDMGTDSGIPDAGPDGCLEIEICNELDDDCDGTADEGIDTSTSLDHCGGCNMPCQPPHAFGECSDGVCGIAGCDVGFLDLNGEVEDGCEYRCLVTEEDDAICDLRDNDCDGLVDEDVPLDTDPDNCGSCGRVCRFPHTDASCADGMCALGACEENFYDIDGVLANGCEYACTPADPAVETCNARDDDCDGTIDEGDPGGGATCGTDEGICTSGIEACVSGAIVCMGSTAPDTEACDGTDNDCDGMVDEGNPDGGALCGSSIGVCEQGRQTCVDGALTCVGRVDGSAETCDGLDNDCDRSIDEGDPEGGGTCGTDVGACSAGVEHCRGGVVVCEGAVGGRDETCNAMDDDCDGSTDEMNPGGGGSCGTDVGICAPGTRQCTGGTLVCMGATGAGTEMCNSLDDDCDGSVDEGDPGGGASCGTDVGACTAGVQRCIGGTVQCQGTVAGTAESCNGIDDDCDGLTDEGNPGGGAACGSAIGECTTGTITCTGGTLTCAGGTRPMTETCDGLDEDCDGRTDEGVPTDGTCGTDVGECSFGLRVCTGGSYVCTGGNSATMETCDGRDNDCDGSSDEGDPGGGGACGIDTGSCSFGTLACSAGSLQCVGGSGPSTETCNGADDDCDGSTDEGNPGGGALCGNGTGECVQGTRTCTGGTLQCVGGVGPGTETCDALDNDCDGSTDEGNPDGGAACGNGTGECMQGMQVCTGGALECSGGTGPSLETCDTADNDCDGSTDEDFDTANDINNCGGCGIVCSYMNANAVCSGGTCMMTTCDSGFYDINGSDADGCEYACSFNGAEACNGVDDDCDMATDEGLTPPSNFCNPNGVCAGTSATCGAGAGWVCNYPATYEDGGETRCDGLDNDCNGLADDPFPLLGTSCGNGTGACRVSGTFVCNAMQTGTECNAGMPLDPDPEDCDDVDNDCDGIIDENIDPSNIATVTMTLAGGGGTFDMFAYEASRPDAAPADGGTVNSVACSRSNVEPWTNVTWGEALAACCAMNPSGTCNGDLTGWRLCDAEDWEVGCQGSSGTCNWAYPTACNSSNTTRCNGKEYDSDSGTGGDQDSIFPTGSPTFPMCYANHGGSNRIYDLSGNVKEWTYTEAATDIHEIRGGSYNNVEPGRTCTFDFTTGDLNFAFPNTGFRCCRY